VNFDRLLAIKKQVILRGLAVLLCQQVAISPFLLALFDFYKQLRRIKQPVLVEALKLKQFVIATICCGVLRTGHTQLLNNWVKR
jgi:hypothetical protein